LVPEIDNSEIALLEAFDEHHTTIKNVGKIKHNALRKTFIQLVRGDF
jgi:chorismate mutase